MEIEIDSRWINAVNSVIEQLPDGGLIVLPNCGYYKYNAADQTVTVLAEWSFYPQIYSGIVFECIFKSMAMSFIRNAETAEIEDPALLQAWADSNLGQFKNIAVMHPGCLEGTWPNAEMDFQGIFNVRVDE